MERLTGQVQIPESAKTAAVDYSFYLWHLLKEKPVMVVFGTIFSTMFASLSPGIPGHLIAMLALSLLVGIDWITKRDACLKQGIPFTSREMRDKGVLKLRDYMLLYIAGALTMPLMGDLGYRTVSGFIAVCELWSIAENLHDAGRLPFDIRNLALFSSIRELAAGKKEVQVPTHAPSNDLGPLPAYPDTTDLPVVDAPDDIPGGPRGIN